MRRIFIFIAFALCSLWQLRAQADTASFLFDKYEDAQVLLRAGGELKSKMNYSIVVNKFYFIDPQDKQVKELANPGDILLIKIAGRTFYPESNGAGIEMLPTKPVVYVQYKATARKEAPMGAYGTRSETTAVQSYGTITSNGQSYKLEGEKIIVSNRHHVYWVEKDDKMKQFRNFKQLAKIYSKHRAEVEKYIEDNKVNFEDADQIVKLCSYADSLKYIESLYLIHIHHRLHRFTQNTFNLLTTHPIYLCKSV